MKLVVKTPLKPTAFAPVKLVPKIVTFAPIGPLVGEKPPEEDASELISKTLKLERDIARGLEELLEEVEAVE